MPVTYFVQVTNAYTEGIQKKVDIGHFVEPGSRMARQLGTKTYDVDDFADATLAPLITARKDELEAVPEPPMTTNHKTSYEPYNRANPRNPEV